MWLAATIHQNLIRLHPQIHTEDLSRTVPNNYVLRLIVTSWHQFLFLRRYHLQHLIPFNTCIGTMKGPGHIIVHTSIRTFQTQKFTRRQWAGTMSLVNCAPLPYPTGRGAILLLHCSKGTFFCIPPDPFLPDSEQCAILFSPSPLLYIDISWHLFMSYSSHPYCVPCSTPWRPFNDSECDTLSCLSTNPKCHASSYDPPVSPWSIFSFLCSRTFFLFSFCLSKKINTPLAFSIFISIFSSFKYLCVSSFRQRRFGIVFRLLEFVISPLSHSPIACVGNPLPKVHYRLDPFLRVNPKSVSL